MSLQFVTQTLIFLDQTKNNVIFNKELIRNKIGLNLEINTSDIEILMIEEMPNVENMQNMSGMSPPDGTTMPDSPPDDLTPPDGMTPPPGANDNSGTDPSMDNSDNYTVPTGPEQATLMEGTIRMYRHHSMERNIIILNITILMVDMEGMMMMMIIVVMTITIHMVIHTIMAMFMLVKM